MVVKWLVGKYIWNINAPVRREVIVVEETKTKSTRGGARPGAGRKPINGDVPTKRVMFRLTAEQEELVREFLRRLREGEITVEDFKK